MPALMDVYSSCCRGVLTAAPGYELFVGDFSSIEAIVLAWLAGQESTLDVFRKGGDLYCEEACGIFQRSVSKGDKYERSVGKVAVLGLGYQGGVGAFGTMSRSYSVDLIPAYEILWPTASPIEQKLAQSAYQMYLKRCEKAKDDDPLDMRSGLVSDIIKQRWRVKNTKIVSFWTEVEQAALCAVLSGQKTYVGGTLYAEYMQNYWADKESASQLLKTPIGPNNPPVDGRPTIIFGMSKSGHLICRFPSGTTIIYPFAKVTNADTPWGDKKHTLTYKTQNEDNYQYDRTASYGGKQGENITQGVARDILGDAMLRVDEAQFDIVLHCHDEIVSEVVKDSRALGEFAGIMEEVPQWAEGLPVKVEVWKGHRYRK